MRSARTIGDACSSFVERSINNLEVNRYSVDQLMNASIMLVTVLNPHIGYDKASEIANKAHKEAAVASRYLTAKQFDKWIVPSIIA